MFHRLIRVLLGILMIALLTTIMIKAMFTLLFILIGLNLLTYIILDYNIILRLIDYIIDDEDMF